MIKWGLGKLKYCVRYIVDMFRLELGDKSSKGGELGKWEKKRMRKSELETVKSRQGELGKWEKREWERVNWK